MNNNGEIDQNKFETILNKKQYLTAIRNNLGSQSQTTTMMNTIQARSTRGHLSNQMDTSSPFIHEINEEMTPNNNPTRNELQMRQRTLPEIHAMHNRSQSHHIAFGSGDINGKTFSLKPVANQPGYGQAKQKILNSISPNLQSDIDISYKALLSTFQRIPPGGK